MTIRSIPTSGFSRLLGMVIVVAFSLAVTIYHTSAFATATAPWDAHVLPNLVARLPYSVDTDIQPSELDVNGCTRYEVIFEGARRCLRFDTIAVNFGEGPLELRYDLQDGTGDRRVIQRIYREDGSYSDVALGSYEFHPTHAHFHYGRLAVARLWPKNRAGARGDVQPLAESAKAGVCFYDSENYWSGRRPSVPREYRQEDCRNPRIEEEAPTLRSGLSVGWMDIYDYKLDGQYIEISNIHTGSYLLEIVLDPDNLVIESNENDNSVFLPVRIPER